MAFYNNYYENNRTRANRKIILRGITFLLVVFIAIFNVVILFSRKVEKI